MNQRDAGMPATPVLRRPVHTALCGVLLACTLVLPAAASAADTGAKTSESWTPLAHLAPGSSVITMMLLTDGSVFAQSGDDAQHWFLLKPDARGSYVNGTWQVLAPMSFPRLYFASNILPDGRVWVLGGEYTGPYFDPSWGPSGEIYDPVSDSWSGIAPYPAESGGCFPINITSDVQLTAGAPVVTGIYSTDRLLPGWAVAGSGIPAGATILSVDSSSQVTLSAAATAGGAAQAVVFTGTPSACFGDDPSALLPGHRILAGNLLDNSAYAYSIDSNAWTHAADKVQKDESSDEEGWARISGNKLLTYDLFHSIATGQGYAEVYDPALNAWSSISPADGTANGTLPLLSSPALGYELGPIIRLQDGRTLAIGANQHTGLYNQTTNTWSSGPDILGVLSNPYGSIRKAAFGADDAPAALLPNGHVLLVADAGPNPVSGAADTTVGSAVLSGIPSTAGLQVGWSVAQADGKVDVIPGGAAIKSIDSLHQVHISTNANAAVAQEAVVFGGVFSSPTQLFDFDPKAGKISPLQPALADPNLATSAAYVTRLLVLPSGQALFNDGASNQLYVYTAAGGPDPAILPVVQSVKPVDDGVYRLTGLRLNGPSDASSYGDDVQSNENFPIVRLQNAAGLVFFCRTTNWSSTGVGNVGQESVNFTLNPAVTSGSYQLTVVAGGISSTPVAFHVGDR